MDCTICYIDGSRGRRFLLRESGGFRRAILLALVAGCGDAAGVSDHPGDSVVRLRSVLEITNVINDTTYVTAELVNPTNVRVSIGVYEGSTAVCASVLRAASGSVPGFTKIGYYRLLAGTEIRAYHDESRCTGPYVAWPASQLTQFAPKSGLVRLTLTSVP